MARPGLSISGGLAGRDLTILLAARTLLSKWTSGAPGASDFRLNQDVAAGDFEAAYIESFRCRLRRGWRLIASQLPH